MNDRADRAAARLAGLLGDVVAARRPPLVMGVLNVTPDSFSDGGRFFERSSALARADVMREQGADLVDLGGESTRPGAAPVSEAEELDRVIPVIERLTDDASVLVSVDTSRAAVMREAIAAGAAMVNDVRALGVDGALEAVAPTRVFVCLMHMQGTPVTMQHAPAYDDVVTEVRDFLAASVERAVAAGIERDRLLVDPGFGFGKTLQDNLALLRNLSDFQKLGLPLLTGLSRKSMLEPLTGRAVDERLAGSLALATLAVANGAHIIRCHDVAETVDAVRVAAAVVNERSVSVGDHSD